jgi:hypothetical protein
MGLNGYLRFRAKLRKCATLCMGSDSVLFSESVPHSAMAGILPHRVLLLSLSETARRIDGLLPGDLALAGRSGPHRLTKAIS